MGEGARPAIDGATRLLVIIGDPIAQARSPAAVTARLAELRRPAILVPLHVTAAGFDRVGQALSDMLNVDGVVVTYPHKERALGLAARIGRRAEQVGAANALRREANGSWTADMFDGVGLLRAAEALLGSVRGLSVKLLGAGGAGRAIAFALADAGAAELSIHDLDQGRAAELAAQVRAGSACRASAGDARLGPAALLVNATTVGLADGKAMPAPFDDLSAATAVIDIVPREGGTALLTHAQALGCRTAGAGAMVDGQRDAILEFFGLAP